jgi:DNA repair exonuclease SbcCD ATPase subunit
MSEPENNKEAGGFTAEASPPKLDPATAVDALTGETADEGKELVSQDAAKKALQAVQILVENNRAASAQLEALMKIVLDAAEVANRSASTVAATGGQLNKAAERLFEGAKKTAMQSKIVLALAASVLVGTAGTFTFMTVQLHDKVEQVDAMLIAVGKRAVDLKTRLEGMDDIHTALTELNLKQDNTQSVQQAIEDKISLMAESAKAPRKEIPAEAPAKPAAPAAAKAAVSKAAVTKAEVQKSEATDKALSKQLSGLDALIKEQSKAVQNLSTQVNGVQGAVSNVDSLKKEVESLNNLQRQRNQEALQAVAAANARHEKESKDKERELLRERELAKERELTHERELAREKELAREREKLREAEKEKTVKYLRDQSKPNPSTAPSGMPSYTNQGGTQAQ